MKSFRYKLLFWILNFCLVLFSHNVYSTDTPVAKGVEDVEDEVQKILKTLSNITCETRSLDGLFRSDFSHTCVPDPFLSLATSSVVGVGTFLPMLLKLNMTNNDLFEHGKKFPGGQCTKDNRANPENPMMSFGLCSNVKLAVAAAVTAGKIASSVASAVFTGKNPLEAISQAWNIDPMQYFEVHLDKKVGETGNFIDINLTGLPYIPYQIVQSGDKICVAVKGLFGSTLTVGCKYIKEPCPRSIYSSFLDGTEASLKEDLSFSDTNQPLCYSNSDSKASITDINAVNNTLNLVKCSKPGDCYSRATKYSQTILPISSALVECFREMIAKFLISKDVCEISGSTLVSNDSTFRKFQANMHRTVTALLTLYVIFWGMSILLRGEIPEKREFINAGLKIILVVYFSVGINMNATESGNRFDGMTSWVFPTLLNASSEITSWVMIENRNESGEVMSGLCRFDYKEYPADQKYLALWDSLDCRVTHYLGINFLKDAVKEKMARIQDWKHSDPFGFSTPPYYYLLIPALATGNMTLVSLAISYPLMVISVAAYMVNAFIVCMIGILVIGVLAPIFVPMVLFEYTKGYFDQWVKLLISFVLQPMVVAIFMTLMFSIYEYGFYTNCRYSERKVEDVDSEGNTRIRKMFFVNTSDRSLYGSGAVADQKIGQCKKSLGWMLNNPLSAVIGLATEGNQSDTISLTPKSDDKAAVSGYAKDETQDEFKSNFGFLNEGLKETQGFFFKSTHAIFQVLKDMMLAMITACFTLYLIYHISSRLSSFAAEMTEGIDIGGVTIAPQALFKLGMNAVSSLGNAVGSPAGTDSNPVERGGINTNGLANDVVQTGGGDVASDVVQTSRSDVAADLIEARGNAVSNVIQTRGGTAQDFVGPGNLEDGNSMRGEARNITNGANDQIGRADLPSLSDMVSGQPNNSEPNILSQSSNASSTDISQGNSQGDYYQFGNNSKLEVDTKKSQKAQKTRINTIESESQSENSSSGARRPDINDARETKDDDQN